MNTLFKKMKISGKLFISGAAFALPIAVLLYYVISGFNNDIYFTQKEIYGNKYLKPLSSALTNIDKHQRLCYIFNYLNNKEQPDKVDIEVFANEMEICEKEISAAFEELYEVNQKYGDHLETSPADLHKTGREEINPSTIAQKWNDLATKCENMAPHELNERHMMINKDVLSLIRYIGNKSNLILDPDLDSYYMMDISLLVMPMMQKKINQLIIGSVSPIFSDSVSKEKILNLAHISGSIEDDYWERIQEGLDVVYTEDKNYYGLSNTLHEELPKAYSDFDSSLDELFKYVNILINEKSEGVYFNNFRDAGNVALSKGKIFWDTVLLELDKLLEKRIENYQNKRTIAVLISAVALIFAVILVLYVSGSITKPLKALENIAGKISSGNIGEAKKEVQISKEKVLKTLNNNNEKSKMRDETLIVFSAIEIMTENLDSLIYQVQRSAREVSDSAGSITESARDLESSIAQQVSSTNEVNATSKEISSTAKNLAETMNTVSEMATNASALASSGIENLNEMKSIMNLLQSETDDISEKLELINSRTENISDIITKITKVANRTNLLSLNAAIEAERAGEQGAGFSVVAREIRLLADETSVAALDIEDMITETQKAVKEGVSSVESYTEKTNKSSETIASISDEMTEMISHINEIVPKFNSVNDAMQSQSEGADQIKEAMQQLNESAGYTKDALVKFKEINDMLSETLKNMQNELSKFNT